MWAWACFFPKGGGALASQTFLEFPTCAHLVWETTTKFCAVIKLHVTKIFARSATNADARSVSGIANFLMIYIYPLSSLCLFIFSYRVFHSPPISRLKATIHHNEIRNYRMLQHLPTWRPFVLTELEEAANVVRRCYWLQQLWVANAAEIRYISIWFTLYDTVLNSKRIKSISILRAWVCQSASVLGYI